MQYFQPAQNLKVYESGAAEKDWFQAPLASNSPPVGILAENVLAIVILPKLSKADEVEATSKGKTSTLAPDFEYDTRKVTTEGLTDHQLSPVVEVIMVAIDEISAGSQVSIPCFCRPTKSKTI